MRHLVMVTILWALNFHVAEAMVAVGEPAETSMLSATGFFGGIRSGTTFVFLLSEQGRVLYYRVQPNFTILYKGERIPLEKLPTHTPIKVSTEKGLVVGVEVMRIDQ